MCIRDRCCSGDLEPLGETGHSRLVGRVVQELDVGVVGDPVASRHTIDEAVALHLGDLLLQGRHDVGPLDPLVTEDALECVHLVLEGLELALERLTGLSLGLQCLDPRFPERVGGFALLDLLRGGGGVCGLRLGLRLGRSLDCAVGAGGEGDGRCV